MVKYNFINDTVLLYKYLVLANITKNTLFEKRNLFLTLRI